MRRRVHVTYVYCVITVEAESFRAVSVVRNTRMAAFEAFTGEIDVLYTGPVGNILGPETYDPGMALNGL